MSAGGVRVRRRRSRIGRSGAILVATAIAVAVAAILLATGSLSSVGGEASPASVSGSTLRASFADLDGDGFLERSAGEPLVDRTELAPAATPGHELALFAQLSDAHVRDEESPARAVQVDRLGSPVTEAFRPQEALSAQTMAAAVSSLNALAPDAVVVSGDLIDSAQRNELNQALSVLEGGSVEPDSGARGYDGPQAASSADPFIYRPDVDAPTHPGLLEAAQQPFRSPGLDAPWYPVLGNHELLVQGEAPVTAQLERISVGVRRLVELDTSQAIPQRASDAEVLERALSEGLPGRTRATPADPARRYLTAEELIGGFGEASGLGGSAAGATRAQDGLDYHFDVGPDLRLIVLDLVRRTGGSSGRVTGEQVAWLRGELRAADERWIVIASHQPLVDSSGGERALAVLDREPRVVAAISGHAHESSIEPRQSPAGGYWLVQTPSLADYPQQARAFRLVETADGIALETWMIDHSSAGLAAVSRELAYLDAQGGRPRGFAGEAEDRNALLYLER